MQRILQVTVFVTLACIVFGQDDSCVGPTGVDGRCVLIKECVKLKKLIRGSPSDRESLKQWHCGFSGDVPKVCCPHTTAKLKNSCRRLEGSFGTCVAKRLDRDSREADRTFRREHKSCVRI